MVAAQPDARAESGNFGVRPPPAWILLSWPRKSGIERNKLIPANLVLLHRQTLSVISRGSNCPGLQPVAVHRQRRADAAHLDRAQRAEVPRDKNKPELLPEFRGCGESRRLQVALRWDADRGLARMHRRSEQRAGGVHHDDADAAARTTTARERHAAEAVRLHATRRVGSGECSRSLRSKRDSS